MKNKVKVILMMLILAFLCCACGQTYTCSWCGKEVHEAYYDPFDANAYYCKDCAKKYFAPLPYESYRVK